MKRAGGLVVLMAAVVPTILGGCSHQTGGVPTETAGQSAPLLRGIGPDPDTLDPQRARSVEAQTVLRDVCEGLTTLDPHGAVAPGVAAAWSMSADARTYMFHLRPQARWSNGERVVAQDFVAALQRLVDPTTASSYAQVIDVIVNAADIVTGHKAPDTLGVHATDAGTLVIELARPAAYLPALLSHPSTCPIHRPTLKSAGDGFTRPGTMVSDGAFVLKKWVPNTYIELAHNPFYWNDAHTRVPTVRYILSADENAEFLRYRAGQLQITATVPRGQYETIQADFPTQLKAFPKLGTYFYGFNLTRPPFRDTPGLRRALSLVIDRERLARDLLRVGEIPAYGWVPPGTAGYTPQSFDYKNMPIEARIAAARRLYAAAGYTAANPLHVELRYNSGDVHTKLAVAIAATWKDTLGIDVTLTSVEFKTLLQDIDRGDVQIFRSSWSGDYNDAYSFLQYLKSDFGVNLTHYSNPNYDALLKQAAAEANPDARRHLLEQAERLALQDQPLIPIYFYTSKHLVSPRVDGWHGNIMDVVYSKDLALR